MPPASGLFLEVHLFAVSNDTTHKEPRHWEWLKLYIDKEDNEVGFKNTPSPHYRPVITTVAAADILMTVEKLSHRRLVHHTLSQLYREGWISDTPSTVPVRRARAVPSWDLQIHRGSDLLVMNLSSTECAIPTGPLGPGPLSKSAQRIALAHFHTDLADLHVPVRFDQDAETQTINLWFESTYDLRNALASPEAPSVGLFPTVPFSDPRWLLTNPGGSCPNYRFSLRFGDALDFQPTFMAEPECSALLESLRMIPFKRLSHMRRGQRVFEPREVAYFVKDLSNTSYTYSGKTIQGVDVRVSPALVELWNRVEHGTQMQFNSVLINHYRDGNDSVGWHSDDEPLYGLDGTPVACLSLGATRTLLIRRKEDHKEKLCLPVTSGSLYVMSKYFQHTWEHAIPKQRPSTESRISLTFRSVSSPPPVSPQSSP